jgi:hypothetical protein
MAKTYVEKYTAVDNPRGPDLVKIRHKTNNQCQAGFDNTTFASQSDFQDVIKKHNLEYRRVEMPNGRYKYTWSNSKVMLVTQWNPISNKKGDGSTLRSRKNDPNKMGIQGRCVEVDMLAEDLKKNAQSVKAFHPNERAYI